VLGRDCRAFPPTSLAQYHSRTQQTQAVSTPVSASVWWPALASPGNHGNTEQQVRGPWRTPDPLGTPPDRAAYRPAGNRQYLSTVVDQGAGPYQQQTVTDAGYVTAEWAGVREAAWQQNGSDRAELNMSMNRATADDQPATKFVKFSSSSPLDGKQYFTPALAPLTGAEQQGGQLPQTPTTTTGDHDDRLTTSRDQHKLLATLTSLLSLDDRQNETTRTLMTTTGPLTSTPLDHNAPAHH